MRLRQKHYTYSQSPFKKGKVTCPVCGKTHHYHCSVTEDGGLAICKHTSSENQAQDGRYIHVLSTVPQKGFISASSTSKKEVVTERAEADRLHAVYSALLSRLELIPTHGDALLDERGFSDTTIAYNLYASVPDEAEGNETARTLAQSLDLKGVPGFYKEDECWRFKTTIKGFYVPYRDEHGHIVGLQIRRDGNPDPKYLWLTSADKVEGASPGSPLHFVKPEIAERIGEVIITEGALKADRISDFTDRAVVALAGVTAMTPDKFVAALRQAFPKLRKAIIAFDIDWKEKLEVKAALMRMQRTIRQFVAVEILTWDAALGKGFDDALYLAIRGQNNG